MSVELIRTFTDAGKVIQEQGILPLTSFIPNHPSLKAITAPNNWHTGLESDPWLWRDRFAGEGIAAYGRFFAKKPMFISAALFPLAKNALGAEDSVERRYRDGLLSTASLHIFKAIREQDGIDVKSLRKHVGMQQKDDKNEFDKALIELQSSFDVVILGISERLNALGNKSGWNSTCYILAEKWAELQGIELSESTQEAARIELTMQLKQQWDPAAFQYVAKVCKLS
jgi:hypothetical protein